MDFSIKNPCLSPTLGACLLYIKLISITRNIDLADILYSEEGNVKNNLTNLFLMSQIRILFLISHFQKPIVSTCPKKTRPRRSRFKGNWIEVMIILDPYVGPLCRTLMDPLEPIWTY